jgi:soluble lytic murein transglycosylase-like protein
MKESMNDSIDRFSSTILRISGRHIAIITTAVVAVFIILSFLAFYLMGKVNTAEQTKQMQTMVAEMQDIKESQTLGNQFLVSQISYGEERQRVMLFIRDTIFNYWERVNFRGRSIDKAFTIAKNNVEVAEIYPNIDALVLTAIQFQESRWNVLRLSPKGASGLNHIMPTTALGLANQMGLTFSPKMVLDDRINTEMAAKHLDNNYSVYHDWGSAFADYNGGPNAAYYYRKGQLDSMHSEARAYVPDVLKRMKVLKKNLKGYKAEIKNISKSGDKK